MNCNQLYQLLTPRGGENRRTNADIAEHILTCPDCQHGLMQLAGELLTEDVLSCDECLSLLPDYYEATHPGYPLVAMSDHAVTQVARHLGRCAACREEYQELLLLWRIEEREGIE